MVASDSVPQDGLVADYRLDQDVAIDTTHLHNGRIVGGLWAPASRAVIRTSFFILGFVCARRFAEFLHRPMLARTIEGQGQRVPSPAGSPVAGRRSNSEAQAPLATATSKILCAGQSGNVVFAVTVNGWRSLSSSEASEAVAGILAPSLGC
jgi:hypothetical protein